MWGSQWRTETIAQIASDFLAINQSMLIYLSMVTKDLLHAGPDIWAGLPVYRNKLIKVCADQVYL